MLTRDAADVARIIPGWWRQPRAPIFIILDANPLENIVNTRRINKVYLRGKEVDRAGLRAKWQAHSNRRGSTS